MARTKSKGLGDTVEKVIKATKLDKLVTSDCGCEQRKEYLNSLWRYKVVRCLTEQEVIQWAEFVKVRTLRLSKEQVDFVCELYGSVFNRNVWKPCATCSPKPLISMIDKLDKIYENNITNISNSTIN